MHKQHVDRILLVIVITLVVVGFLIFTSASLGLLARNGASFSSVAFSQIVFGIFGGGLSMFLMSQVYYRNWRKYAFHIFVATVVLTLAVFVPGIGMEHGGAQRWLNIFGFTLQPAELLKIGYVIYLATWLSRSNIDVTDLKQGTWPFVAITGVVAVTLLIQPDTDTFFLMAAAGMAMFITAGGRWRDVAGMFVIALILITVLVSMRPYLKDRFTTFLDPEADPQGSGYQIQQSLIAVGAGGFLGNGFGQSIQKFEYLPEPIGDSVFAVFAEEFGFIGSTLLIALFATFTFRGFKIATHARDMFGMLLVVGFMTFIVTQAFLNIAAMLSVAPLMGLPLPFISHGGTALLATLTAVGIVLNVSRYQKKII